jgi:ParB family chromosome partitioning protein
MVTTDTATAARYEKGQLYHIPLTDLQSDPNQPRKYMDSHALEDLAASIAQHGVLTPILFRQGVMVSLSNQDQLEPILYVVAGERRCEAAKKAGLTEVPAILVEGKHGEIALVENLLRQDLTAVEAAGGQRKERTAPTPAAHREWVDKTNAKLTAIDSAAWTEEEKTAFTTALGELKKTILALLKTKTVTPT